MLRRSFTYALLFAVAACSNSERLDGNPALSQIQGFPFPIYVQETTVREWREVGLEAVAVLGASEEQILFRAGSIAGATDGRSYILDYGDLMVKQFDAAGRFVRTLGHGEGEGPGEFKGPMPLSIDVQGNVVVPDAHQRSVTRIGPEGDVLATSRLTDQLFRMALTDEGRYYFMLNTYDRDAHMFGTTQGLDEPLHTFGTSDLEPLGLGGEIEAVDSDLIYSPTYYGVIVRFAPEGDIVFARETMDQVEPPTFESLEIMGTTALRFKSSTPAKYILAYSDGSLYVESRALSAEMAGTVVDVFDAADGSYSYSFEVPGRWRDMDVSGNYLFALQDTMGTVFELRP